METAAEFVDALETTRDLSPVTPTKTSDPVPEAAEESTLFSQSSINTSSHNEGDSLDSSVVASGLPESVCSFVNFDFADLTVNSIRSEVTFDDNRAFKGGRRTAYFGLHPYSYGTFTHHSAPYPECTAFDTIFQKMLASTNGNTISGPANRRFWMLKVQTWAPPKMLRRRREAVFHSAAAYRRLEPIFW